MTEMTLQEMARQATINAARAKSWTDISNLFARHVYMVRSGKVSEDYKRLWSRRDDVCYMVNETGFSGRAAVQGCFVEAKEAVQRNVLTDLSNYLDGKVENEPENLGAGEYELHSLLNPFIQVAGDNGTAKGVWWSPGIAGHVTAEGEYQAYAAAILYTVDFIRENDTWKIWHLREQDEISVPMDGASIDRSVQQAKDGGRGGPGGPDGFMMRRMEKDEIRAMLDRGESPGGRTGETIRTLYDLPPAQPEHNLSMTDRPKTTLLRPNRMIDDMVEPYESWDESMSVLRDY